MRKTPLLVHSLSTDKTLVQPPCGTPSRLGTLRPQANVLEISEQIGAPEVSVQDPHLCGHVPMLTIPITSYGHVPMLTIPITSYGQIATGRTNSLPVDIEVQL